MNRLFRRVYKHLDPKCKNSALTFATLRSKANDGVFVNPCKLSACNCFFCWLLHTHAML